MLMKIYPAFGWYVVKHSFDTGEIFSDELFLNNVYTIYNPSPYGDGRFGNTLCGYQWLYVAGRVRTTNLETGEYADRTPGYCNLVTWEQVGTFRADFVEPTTLFCINALTNQEKGSTVPNTTYFGLSAGQKTVIPEGTKLFLADGELLVNGSSIKGSRQIQFSSGDKEVEALRDTYGYIFP